MQGEKIANIPKINPSFLLILFSNLIFFDDFQFASLDRKIIELYDDLMSQVSNPAASKGKTAYKNRILSIC